MAECISEQKVIRNESKPGPLQIKADLADVDCESAEQNYEVLSSWGANVSSKDATING